jgi:hypothetical protein
VRADPLSPTRLRELAAAEPFRLDDELKPIDSLLTRWGATPAGDDGVPRLARPSLLFAHSTERRAMPLQDHDMDLVEAAVRSSPGWVRMFAIVWYRLDLPLTAIGEKMSLKSRSSVYSVRSAVLAYYLGALRSRGLQLARC